MEVDDNFANDTARALIESFLLVAQRMFHKEVSDKDVSYWKKFFINCVYHSPGYYYQRIVLPRYHAKYKVFMLEQTLGDPGVFIHPIFSSCPMLVLGLMKAGKEGWDLIQQMNITQGYNTLPPDNYSQVMADTIKTSKELMVKVLNHLPDSYTIIAKRVFEKSRNLREAIPPMFWSKEDFLKEYETNTSLAQLVGALIAKRAFHNHKLGTIVPSICDQVSHVGDVYDLLEDRYRARLNDGLAKMGEIAGTFVFQRGAKPSKLQEFFRRVIEDGISRHVMPGGDAEKVTEADVDMIGRLCGEMHEGDYRWHIHLNMVEDLLDMIFTKP